MSFHRCGLLIISKIVLCLVLTSAKADFCDDLADEYLNHLSNTVPQIVFGHCDQRVKELRWAEEYKRLNDLSRQYECGLTTGSEADDRDYVNSVIERVNRCAEDNANLTEDKDNSIEEADRRPNTMCGDGHILCPDGLCYEGNSVNQCCANEGACSPGFYCSSLYQNDMCCALDEVPSPTGCQKQFSDGPAESPDNHSELGILEVCNRSNYGPMYVAVALPGSNDTELTLVGWIPLNMGECQSFQRPFLGEYLTAFVHGMHIDGGRILMWPGSNNKSAQFCVNRDNSFSFRPPRDYACAADEELRWFTKVEFQGGKHTFNFK